MRKMKDSGVEWIGEIPDKWQTRNLFLFVKFNRKWNYSEGR